MFVIFRPHEPQKEEEIPEKPSKDGKTLSKEESDAETKAKQEASLALNRENLIKCLGKLTKESLAKGKDQFDTAWAKFQEVLDKLPEEDKNKPLKPLPVSLSQSDWCIEKMKTSLYLVATPSQRPADYCDTLGKIRCILYSLEN